VQPVAEAEVLGIRDHELATAIFHGTEVARENELVIFFLPIAAAAAP